MTIQRKMYKSKASIGKWLDKMGIKNYSIHEDLIVDVNDNVSLNNKELFFIPIQFGIVEGSFEINHNYLTNLLGSPEMVGGEFSAMRNNLLTLEGSPKKIRHNFLISLNSLTSLANGPEFVGNHYICVNNDITLEDFTTDFKGNFIHGYTYEGRALIEGLKDYYATEEKDLTKGYKSFCEIDSQEFNKIRTILSEKQILEHHIVDNNQTNKKQKI
jgi:hypothetical protein